MNGLLTATQTAFKTKRTSRKCEFTEGYIAGPCRFINVLNCTFSINSKHNENDRKN